MKLSTITRQIAYCQAIIDRATTSETERLAAESAKDRLEALRAKAAPSAWAWTPRFQGGKYQAIRHLYGADLTKLIRAEIALRRKLGKITGEPGSVAVPDPIADAPQQIKITVSHPQGRAVTITVRNVPQDWHCPRPKGINYAMSPGPSDDLLRLGIALRELADEYNMDDSDTQADHHHVRFYLNVYDESRQSIDRDYWRTLAEAEYVA